MIRNLLLLIIALVIFGQLYTQDDANALAGAAARQYCSTRPTPQACLPDGHPTDALKQFVGLGPEGR